MTERRLRLASAALASAGAAIAGYLTWTYYAGLAPICIASGGCRAVQASEYSTIGAVPVAAMGLIVYIALLVTSGLSGEWPRRGGALFAFVGLAFSAYLTYVEIAVIRSLCQWCVASAVIMSALAALAAWRVIAAPQEDVEDPPVGARPLEGAPQTALAEQRAIGVHEAAGAYGRSTHRP